jgi:tRNA pseudouridine13 synthase
VDGPRWAPGYRHRTADVAPVSLRFKASPEDFVVHERAAEPPSGEGGHLWLHVEKRGLATVDAARRLAEALDREPRQVGFAGRKDVHAVTRQWISIEGADPDRARGLAWRDLRVLDVERSERGLRMGQLAGNRFELVLRDVQPASRSRLEEVLGRLERDGLPNYFGSQRFGVRGTTQELGRHLLAGDDAAYMRTFLEGEGPVAAELLRRISEGTWSERRAAGELADRLDQERASVARQLVRRPKHLEWLVRAVSKRARRFQLSALQGVVFNRVVAARLGVGGLDAWWEGDLVRSPTGVGYVPVPSAREDPPLARSATGPIPGARGPCPEGRAAELEAVALAAEGIRAGAFEGLPAPLRSPGTRRALRVAVTEIELAWEGEVARLAFALPAGSYATTLLEEVVKEHGAGTSFREAGPS